MSLVGGTKILIWQEKYSLLYSLSNAYVGKAQSIKSFIRNFYSKQFFHWNMNFSENAHASARSPVLTRGTNFTLSIK